MYSGLPSALRFALCLALPYLISLTYFGLCYPFRLSSSPSPFPPRLRCPVCSALLLLCSILLGHSSFAGCQPKTYAHTHSVTHSHTLPLRHGARHQIPVPFPLFFFSSLLLNSSLPSLSLARRLSKVSSPLLSRPGLADIRTSSARINIVCPGTYRLHTLVHTYKYTHLLIHPTGIIQKRSLIVRFIYPSLRCRPAFGPPSPTKNRRHPIVLS
ncbi:hypothetical protein V8C43DRAFT_176159 [Trichoderma afarasin]